MATIKPKVISLSFVQPDLKEGYIYCHIRQKEILPKGVDGGYIYFFFRIKLNNELVTDFLSAV